MTQKLDTNDELRAAFGPRLLENAKRTVHPQSGPIGVFMRVTLALIFMYLTVISYMMFGTAGLVFISVLALVAYFIPHLYRAMKNRLEKRREQTRGLVAQKAIQES